MNPVYQGGPLLSSVEAIAIFATVDHGQGNIENWHSLVDNSVLPEVCFLDAFLYDITDSAYLDLLSKEYSVQGGQTIQRGQFLGSFFVAVPGVVASTIVDDADIRRMLEAATTSGPVPRATPNSCYFVFTQNDVKWQGKVSNVDFGGYHDRFVTTKGLSILYVVVPFPTSNPFTESTYTLYISHELAECVTDPFPNTETGWADPATGHEIADDCDNEAIFHGFTVRPFWSRTQNKCLAPSEDNARKPAPTSRIVLHAGGTCFGNAVEGEVATFSVVASRNGQSDTLTTFLWSSGSAQLLNSPTSPQAVIRAPSPPAPFTVDVQVTDVLGCTITASRTIQTVSVADARFQGEFCQFLQEIRTTAIVNWIFNPLINPNRDLGLNPITGAEKRAVIEVAQQLRHLTALWSRDVPTLETKARATRTWSTPKRREPR